MDHRPGLESDKGFASTLAKGLAILECFQPGDLALGNTELANRTGLARPTAARLSSTLADLGYLKYDAKRAKFRLGARTIRLAWPVLADMRIRLIARPLMQELAHNLGATVSLGVHDELSVIYIESARGGEMAPYVPEIGLSLPLLRTAMGRALVSLLEPDQRDALGVRFVREQPQMWRDYESNFRAGLRQCMQDGFCLSEGDLEPSVHGVAVPLFRSSTTDDGFALNCAVAAFRLKPGELSDGIGPRLKALAATLRVLAGKRAR